MYVVLCNSPPDMSRAIARTLIEERLAACVNLIPEVMTYYYWKDRYCEEDEHTLTIKVPKAGLEAMKKRLIELHPYGVPEVIVLEPKHVDDAYLDWVYDTCRMSRGGQAGGGQP